jgi:hypothetical protein
MPKVYARVFKIDGGERTQVYTSSSRNGRVLAERWVDKHYELFCDYRISLDGDGLEYDYQPKGDYDYVIRRRHHHLGITRFAHHFNVDNIHTDIDNISRAWWRASYHDCARFTQAEAERVVGLLRKAKRPGYIDYISVTDAVKPLTHTWLKMGGSVAVCKACGMLRKSIYPGPDNSGQYPIEEYYRGGHLQPLPRAPAKTPACGRVWLTGSANVVEVGGVRMILLPPIDPEADNGTGNELSGAQTEGTPIYSGPRTSKSRKRNRTPQGKSASQASSGSEVFTARSNEKD